MQMRASSVLLEAAGPSVFGRATRLARAARPAALAATSSSTLRPAASAASSIRHRAGPTIFRRLFASTSSRRQDVEGAAPAAWTCTCLHAISGVGRDELTASLLFDPVASESADSNYFEILDLPAEGSFDLDEGTLKRMFLLKSRLVHPDGFKGASEVRPRPAGSKCLSA